MVQVLLIDWLKVGWVLVGGWVWWVGLLASNISVSSPGILKMVHQVDWWCSCWRWCTTPCPSSHCPPELGWVVGPQYFHVISWHFENGASSILMMFLLKMVDYSMSFLSLSTWFFFDGQVGWTILIFWTFLWDPSFILKSLGWVVVVVVGGGWPTGF